MAWFWESGINPKPLKGLLLITYFCWCMVGFSALMPAGPAEKAGTRRRQETPKPLKGLPLITYFCWCMVGFGALMPAGPAEKAETRRRHDINRISKTRVAFCSQIINVQET